MFYRRTGQKASIKRIVRSMAEKKVWDVRFSVFSDSDPPVNWAGYILSLTAVPQGYTDTQRIGDKCTGSSLRLCIYSEPPGQNSTASPPIQPDGFNNLRVVPFVWRDDTDPEIGDIFDGTDGTSVSQAPLYHLNHDKKVKRKILDDTMIRATTTWGLDTNGNTVTQGSWNVPLLYAKTINLTKLRRGDNIINFQGGTTNGVNKIYVALIAPHNNTTGPDVIRCWNYYFICRYTFYDM